MGLIVSLAILCSAFLASAGGPFATIDLRPTEFVPYEFSAFEYWPVVQRPLPDEFRPIRSANGEDLGFFLGTKTRPSDEGLAQVDLVTRVRYPRCFTPKVSFECVRRLFVRAGKHPIFMVASAYHDNDVKIEGLAYDNGASVGYPNIFDRHSALVEVSEGGQFRFHYLPTLSEREQNQLIDGAIENRADLFQQHFAVNNSVSTSSRFNRPDLEDHLRYKMRFLVVFKSGEQGVIQFDKRFIWSEAMKQLEDLQVTNAVYLDMGSLSNGAVVYPDGSMQTVGDTNSSVPRGPYFDAAANFTNLLVFYKQ